MSNKQLIIDGYNLIKTNPDLKNISPDISLQRDHLVKILHSAPSLRSSKITVIFDGSGDVIPKGKSRIKVKFSGRAREADDIIREMIRNSPHPEQLEIVSSDRDIQFTARSHGSTIIGSGYFWKRLKRKGKEYKAQSSDTDNSYSELSQREVKKWLEIFGRRREDDDEF